MGFLQQTDIVATIVGGIIGILGSLATIVVTEILRNKGKLVLFTNKSKILFHKNDNAGGEIEALGRDDAEEIEFSFDIDVYNQSDVPKNLGEFRVELNNKNSKMNFATKLYKRSGSYFIPYSQDVPTLTILPKQSANIECKTYLQQSDLSPFGSKIDIYLLAKLPDRRRFRVKVLEMNENQNITK